MKGAAGAIPPGLKALYDQLKAVSLEAMTGIETPEAVVRMTVLDAMMQFAQLTGRPPKLLYITKAMEAALQVDRHRNLGYEEGSIRKEPTIFTCRVVWDALAFKIE